jgi:hypothetical protein
VTTILAEIVHGNSVVSKTISSLVNAISVTTIKTNEAGIRISEMEIVKAAAKVVDGETVDDELRIQSPSSLNRFSSTLVIAADRVGAHLPDGPGTAE